MRPEAAVAVAEEYRRMARRGHDHEVRNPVEIEIAHSRRKRVGAGREVLTG